MPPSSSNANISNSTPSTRVVSSPAANSVDGASMNTSSNSEVNTESNSSDDNEIASMGAKSPSHAEHAGNEIIYLGYAKRQIVIGGDARKSAQTAIDLTTTASIFEHELGQFCYGDSAQAE
ncbi:hypothetical protein BT96DRAFT_1007234 [Gymnopus androsaceus JB14]|uniref:Uncharacterized protein n=1 Tax=Gymnopus androsaceus JB14 TaxID=1447944 RepID=A0A6A4GIC8_9AGAR|nr:hypothetical protein BT96DRAFT_1007234 [Gymnopus androsaceus JB14]